MIQIPPNHLSKYLDSWSNQSMYMKLHLGDRETLLEKYFCVHQWVSEVAMSLFSSPPSFPRFLIKRMYDQHSHVCSDSPRLSTENWKLAHSYTQHGSNFSVRLNSGVKNSKWLGVQTHNVVNDVGRMQPGEGRERGSWLAAGGGAGGEAPVGLGNYCLPGMWKLPPPSCEGFLFSHTSAEHLDTRENSEI